MAKKSGETYVVHEIEQPDILIFEGLAKMFKWTLVKTDNIKRFSLKTNDSNFYINYEYGKFPLVAKERKTIRR